MQMRIDLETFPNLIYILMDVFREKEKEAKRRELEALASTKRSSSRIETLKKGQEEKDRLLAIQVSFLLFIWKKYHPNEH